MLRAVDQGGRLPGAAVSLSLQVFKTQIEKALNNLI